MAEGLESSRKNKDPKRTKQQQLLIGFLNDRKATKEDITKRPVVQAVTVKRAANGKRLLLSGERQRRLSEKAKQSRKEAEEATMEEESKGGTPKKQISFSKGGGPTKTSTP